MIENRIRQTAVAGIAAAVIAVATLLAGGPADAGDGHGDTAHANVNPGVVPNRGDLYGDLGAKWWKWAYSFPAADVPFFNTGGPVDASEGNSGHDVWFLAGANSGPTKRTATVPTGVYLFFPMANFINDYPCPEPPPFQPAPGESLEDFLQRTGSDILGTITDLFAEIDGKTLTDLASYRAISDMFAFKADPALKSFDPCVTGKRQPGVAVGYWLLLKPLRPGVHTLHFGAPSWGQDVTYVLTVKRRHGNDHGDD